MVNLASLEINREEARKMDDFPEIFVFKIELFKKKTSVSQKVTVCDCVWSPMNLHNLHVQSGVHGQILKGGNRIVWHIEVYFHDYPTRRRDLNQFAIQFHELLFNVIAGRWFSEHR
jgi:hypothetical protein